MTPVRITQIEVMENGFLFAVDAEGRVWRTGSACSTDAPLWTQIRTPQAPTVPAPPSFLANAMLRRGS
jgi:hypothetical protein